MFRGESQVPPPESAPQRSPRCADRGGGSSSAPGAAVQADIDVHRAGTRDASAAASAGQRSTAAFTWSTHARTNLSFTPTRRATAVMCTTPSCRPPPDAGHRAGVEAHRNVRASVSAERFPVDLGAKAPSGHNPRCRVPMRVHRRPWRCTLRMPTGGFTVPTRDWRPCRRVR